MPINFQEIPGAIEFCQSGNAELQLRPAIFRFFAELELCDPRKKNRTRPLRDSGE
jgi:hypothetical protein